ncbi:glycosyltransferase family 1 protein [Leptospira kmetyi]|uniref:glycosyltransferase family 4 protein n=1 Tax=Leptospira kmetyi TaxID=408139 RepID=UPI000288546E|nr:glycosyltransferase family 1 protein [Leptospira kmetyi]EQA52470.1 glycosyltransferase, group 1 family protein [Leptospira kmetyi serovar Malaysia str. Bejo-Iso9]PJZ43092.1 glycosyltransferase family 1 protein [Leptospira kmetyi]
MILGIDASNIRGGGGVTHLVELLNAAKPNRYGFEKVIVWGGRATLDKIQEKPWLVKECEPLLDKSLLHRIFWNRFVLNKRLKETKTDIFFAPGGTYSGNFRPFVTMSQNLLPFEWDEIKRYGFSKRSLRLIALFFTQSLTFKKANGVIFLTQFARDVVLKKIKLPIERTAVVNHGINRKFFQKPKVQAEISSYSLKRPFRILYVSFIGEYKHQWNVVKAVGILRRKKYPIVLDLIGTPDEEGPLFRLRQAIAEEDPDGKFINYFSSIPYSDIEKKYMKADLFVFASSCETFGQIVTEAMAAGMPIVCSNRSAMPEILKDAGGYFDPLDVPSISSALQSMIDSKKTRSKVSKSAFDSAKKFSWDKAADETFAFLKDVKGKYQR